MIYKGLIIVVIFTAHLMIFNSLKKSSKWI